VNPITIGTVTLPGDLFWSDEFAQGSDMVGQQESITITGAVVVQASAQQAGRLMTLQTIPFSGGANQYVGVVSRAQVVALRALAETAGAVYIVTLSDGRTFDAMFRRTGGSGVIGTLIFGELPESDDDWFSVTINLLLV
jgi:hypothetical protein